MATKAYSLIPPMLADLERGFVLGYSKPCSYEEVSAVDGGYLMKGSFHRLLNATHNVINAGFAFPEDLTPQNFLLIRKFEPYFCSGPVPRTSSLSISSNVEQGGVIRTAIILLCMVLFSPPHLCSDEIDAKVWEEVQVRIKSLSELQHTWGMNGEIGGRNSAMRSAQKVDSVYGKEIEMRVFGEALRDGYVLCQFMNKLQSSTVIHADPLEDGFICTSNVTKFLAYCSSCGIPAHDLFDRDDLIKPTAHSLARVARTIIVLIKHTEKVVVDCSKSISEQAKNHSSRGEPHNTRLYIQDRSLTSPSSPDLRLLQWSSSPVVPSAPIGERRKPPTPPRLPLHSQHSSPKLQEAGGRISFARSRTRSEEEQLTDPAHGSSDSSVYTSLAKPASRQFAASGSRTEITAFSSLQDFRQSRFNKSKSKQTITKGTASSSRTGVNSVAAPSAGALKKRVTNSQANIAQSKEHAQESVEHRVGTIPANLLGKTKRPSIPPDVPRLPGQSDPVHTLPKSLGVNQDHCSTSALSASESSKKLASLSRRNKDACSFEQLPRRPQHSAMRCTETPAAPDKIPVTHCDEKLDAASPVRLTPHRSGPYVLCSENTQGSFGDLRVQDKGTSLVPFPRAASGEHGPKSVPPAPSTGCLPCADSPLLNNIASSRRSRSISCGSSRSRPQRPVESLVNLSGASGHATANDLSLTDSSGGSRIRKILVVTEDGKATIHLKLGNCIGRGQFGSVYRALNLHTGQMVAVKRICLEGLNEDEVNQLMREVDLVKSLSHPGIVKYEGMAKDEHTLSIVLEYAENGSLGQILKAFGQLNERLVACYVAKILEGLHYLHTNNVVHCDLKAANILTTKTGNVKLSDFGVSLNLRAMKYEVKNVVGTPNWMAPEVIELKGASTKSDIWSLACTIIELLTGRPPYAEIPNSMCVMFRVVEDHMPPIPDECSESLRDFLVQCFNKDPAKRPSAELLCEHP